MVNDWLTHFADWLGTTGLTGLVAGTFWIVPALQTLHILAVAVVLVGTLFINLRIIGVLERGQSVDAVVDRFMKPVMMALLVLAFSGGLLVAAEPTRALFRSLFWIKLGLIVLATLLTLSHRAVTVTVNAAKTAQPIKPMRKAAALLSLMLWIGVISAGRWIAYVEAWQGAPS